MAKHIIYGTESADVLAGLSGTNTIYGLGGNDFIQGNILADLIDGGDGDDNINGLAGNDTILGGAGIDTIWGGAGNDVIYGGDGNDILGDGSGFDDGMSLDKVYGDEGDDTIYTFSGNDTLFGGNGNDYFDASFSVGSNRLNGDAGNDTFYGASGNDTIDGGIGDDLMLGGRGDEVYYVDSALDVVYEMTDQGMDKVFSTISYTLTSSVENLTLQGTLAIDGTGNDLNNLMTGNGSDNILNGAEGNDTLLGGAGNDELSGGLGIDSMRGGLGDDIYYVDDVSDLVVELSNQGTDTVYSSIGFTLGANQENLVLQDTESVADINATGNSLNNILTGNAGNNSLNAGNGADTILAAAGNDTLTGGTGNDMLNGGLGDDTYVLNRSDGVDSISDADATIGNVDLLWYKSGVNSSQLWFQQAGNDLLVSVIGTSNNVTIVDWYSGETNQIENFKASDGKVLLNTEVSALVDAMASFAPPPSGQTTLSKTYQTALNPVLAANWS